MNMRRIITPPGFGIAEVAVAAGIIAVGVVGVLSAYISYQRSAGSLTPSVQSMLLAEEGIEATKVMRDTSWNTTLGLYTANTPYFLAFDTASSTWEATTTLQPEIGAEFYRTITFQSVNRDGSDEITQSGGTQDPKTKLVTVAVSWLRQGATTTTSLSSYVMDLFNN